MNEPSILRKSTGRRMVGEVARAAGILTVAEYLHSAATLEMSVKYGIDTSSFIGKPTAQPEMATTPSCQTASRAAKRPAAPQH